MTKTLRLALRFLFKYRNYSLLNIFGLSLSLACVLFTVLYLYDELSFDRFHSNADRIYRVVENKTSDTGDQSKEASVAFRLSNLNELLPSVQRATKVTTFNRTNVSDSLSTYVYYESFTTIDENFFRIFDFEFLHGNRESCLKEPNTVVITRDMAERLFGTTEAENKLIYVGRSRAPYRVTGVLENFPVNSHMNFSILFSFNSMASQEWYKRGEAGDWTSNFYSTYYLLQPEARSSDVEKELNRLVKANRPENSRVSSFSLQPLDDIHFNSADIRGGYNRSAGEIAYLYIFGAVGLFVLVIACINYINLATSLSVTRGKEVGIKKVAGARNRTLVAQFLTESVVMVIVSLAFALGVVSVFLDFFNTFTGKVIHLQILFQGPHVALLLLFGVVLGIVSGAYPAFYLSRFKPVLAIKGFSKASRSNSNFRKGLVVFQFTLSIMMIISTLVAWKQINFIRTKSLGFNEEQLVVLDINSGSVRGQFETIKTELGKIDNVKSVCVTSRVPGEWKNLARVKVVQEGESEPRTAFFIGADDQFLTTFEIELLSGRNFSSQNMADSSTVLINETAARQFGISALDGTRIQIPSVNMAVSEEPLERPFEAQVIGIVRDFHFQSLHEAIGPMVIAYHNNPIQAIDYYTVRLLAGRAEQSLKQMEKVIHSVDPNHLLEYNFLDERLTDFYRQDLKRSQLFTTAGCISVLIACLGLFSLASFNTEQRTKEIGIRKVLGASVQQITFLLSKDYILLVLTGFLIAVPLSFYALSSWLETFAYKAGISWGVIVLSGLLSIVIALLTIGYKSIHAAVANPVESLRNE